MTPSPAVDGPSRWESSRTRQARSRSSGSPTRTWPGWSSATSTPGAASSAGTSSSMSRTAARTTPCRGRQARKLVEQDRVDVLFGGIFSSTRQAIKGPAVVEGKTLYIYPEQYEGQESDPLIFCTGPVPAQQVDPFVPWLMRETGARTFYLPVRRLHLAARLNERVREVVTADGGTIVGEEYFPLDHMDYARPSIGSPRAAPRSSSTPSCLPGSPRSWGCFTTPASRSAADISSAPTSTRTS